MSTTQFIDQKLFAESGEQIGTIRDVISRPADLAPEWLVVKTGFIRGEHLVPICSVRQRGVTFTVPFDKATVKNSPAIGAHVAPPPAQSKAMYRYYGVAMPR